MLQSEHYRTRANLAVEERNWALTRREQRRNISLRLNKPWELAMSESATLPDIDHYEQACDQAIAMCDGNLRSTIKALIMANEYLEAELQELQASVSAGCAPAHLAQASSDAA